MAVQTRPWKWITFSVATGKHNQKLSESTGGETSFPKGNLDPWIDLCSPRFRWKGDGKRNGCQDDRKKKKKKKENRLSSPRLSNLFPSSSLPDFSVVSSRNEPIRLLAVYPLEAPLQIEELNEHPTPISEGDVENSQEQKELTKNLFTDITRGCLPVNETSIAGNSIFPAGQSDPKGNNIIRQANIEDRTGLFAFWHLKPQITRGIVWKDEKSSSFFIELPLSSNEPSIAFVPASDANFRDARRRNDETKRTNGW